MSVAEATNERNRVLSELEVANQQAFTEGIEVLRRRAATGKPFSSNDVREELRAVGVAGRSTGALFGAAIAAHIIHKVGSTPSDDTGTHRKPVFTYRAGPRPNNDLPAPSSPAPEEVVVPIRRKSDGKFATATANPPAEESSLLDWFDQDAGS